MFDLEERLRTEARQEAGAFVPSPGLPERVAAGIRRRRRRHMALAAAAVLVVGLGAAGVAALTGEAGRVEMAPPAGRPTAPPTTSTRRTPVTPAPETTPTAPGTTTSTAAGETPSETPSTPGPTGPDRQPPILDPGDSPVTWTGIGEVRAGDSLRSVQATQGLEFTWSQESFEAFGRVCFPADAAGLDRLTFLVKSPDGVPLADPLDGVIEVVGGSEARTEAGVGAGNTVADLRTVYGEPTRIEDTPMYEGRTLWTYDALGGSLGFVVIDDEVVAVWAGSVSPDDIEPCA